MKRIYYIKLILNKMAEVLNLAMMSTQYLLFRRKRLINPNLLPGFARSPEDSWCKKRTK